jgi:hypothetical protein
MGVYLNIAQIIISVALIAVILLQVRSGGMGGVFGGTEVWTAHCSISRLACPSRFLSSLSSTWSLPANCAFVSARGGCFEKVILSKHP